jgi:predicted O-linked N-acetylglucosamine transferase (SPINDLY family)
MSLQQLCDQAAGLLRAGRPDHAARLYLEVLEAEPSNFAACQALGIIRFQQNRLAEALDYFDRTAKSQPGFGPYSNRGAALHALGRFDEALASYASALALQPNSAAVHYNRGRVLQDLGQLEEALASYDRALALDPKSVAALTNRGNTLRVLNRPKEALACYDAALSRDPDFVEALYNRGDLQWAVNGNYAAALRDMERAAAIGPDQDFVLGELLYLRLHGGDWRDFESLRARIAQAVRAGRRVVQPFHFQAMSDSPAELQACSITYTRNLYPPAPALVSKVRGGDRIRLGYVAGEFREHATSFLMAGLFEAHDRERFELIAFDNGWDDGSAMRGRLKSAFHEIVDISRLSDRAAAQKVAARGIDILVSLNGYVGLHRMGVFAQRPSPIQVNYLGFPATTGAPYMDYILADRVLIPPEEERFYSEKVVTLPNSYQVNDSKRAIATPLSRAELGLPENGFVFCSFNSSYKLTPGMFRLWCEILKQVPGSVLWLLESNPAFAANLRRAAASFNVAPERLVFAPMIPMAQHLARMSRADLFLDLLPCGAHTTASDALWAGLPLVTCRGHAFPGRVAASLLQALGLPELITENWDDYKKLVLRLAGDPQELAAVKAKMAANRTRMPLFDTALSCRHIEQAFTTMVEIARRGEAPRGFAV